MSGKHGAGKGSRYRPVDHKKYAENWEKIFGDTNRKRNPQSNAKGVSKRKKNAPRSDQY